MRQIIAVLALLLAAPALAQKADTIGSNWYIGASEDPMTGAKNVNAYTMSLTRIPDTIRRMVSPTLIVRCERNKTELLINWDRFITTGGLDNGTHVMIRLDDEKPMRTEWQMSTNFNATFSRNPIPLIRAMRNKTKLRAETIPYGSSSVLAVFDISGMPEVIERVSKQCGWGK
jgi:type VI secretion system protein VasI